LLEVAGVEARCFPGLNGREDLCGLRPPIWMDDLSFEPERFQFADCAVEAGHNSRFAIMKKAVCDSGEAGEAGMGNGLVEAKIAERSGAARIGASWRSRKSQPMVSKDSARCAPPRQLPRPSEAR